jgi:hypothetical protein
MLAATGGACVVAACVLAEPPGDLPVDPPQAPRILHENVVPPVTSLLESWPTEFVVPIEALDPSSVVQWHAFVDYDPIARGDPVLGELDPDPTNPTDVRTLFARLAEPADLGACHTIEIVVALSFLENHTPGPPGGDSVTWFYAPSGSLDGCSIVDASVDAGPDAGDADAEDGPREGGGG